MDDVPTRAVAEERHRADASGRIGPYRLIQRLGEGGMGEVWEAEQLEPVRRMVALKLIKRGMDSKEVVARFESERQALALMEHSNIARVFDAGETERGRPYFVMELVKGLPITHYCDQERVTTRECLELFVSVCEGVNHAHQKGIIHRDLKPSNILVTLREGKPVPKIIDFGIAKAIQQRLTEHTIHTQLGQWVGTPEFMSPEQAEMSGLDVDIRTDVYSLGAVLYELLVGARVFDGTELRRVSYDEMRRMIREISPARPSTRVSTLGERSAVIAERRGLDVPGLVRGLRGDLDWIVMKALEKERERRYSSALELGRDVERFLRSEPVVAGPPGVAYRARKFVARHRVGVGVAAFALVLLVGSMVAISLALLRARSSERLASDRATEAEQVRDFLVDVFSASDPYTNRGDEPTVRELLERGVERVSKGLGDQPAVRVQMLMTLGRAKQNLGLGSEADEIYAEAEEDARALEGRGDVVGTILSLRAIAQLSQGASDQALASAREGVELLSKSEDSGRRLLAAKITLARVLFEAQSFQELVELLEEAFALDRELQSGDPILTASLHRLSAMAFTNLGEEDRALDHAGQALALYESADPTHPELAEALLGLSVLTQRSGQLEETVALLQRALALQERVFGEEHIALAGTLNDLGVAYWYAQDLEETGRYWRETLRIRQANLGPDNPAIASALGNLGLLARAQLRLGEAESYYRQSLEILEAAYGTDAPGLATHLANLGLLLMRVHKAEDGLQLVRRSVALNRAAAGELAEQTLRSRQHLSHLLRATGRFEEGKQELDALIDLAESRESPSPRLIADSLMSRARLSMMKPRAEPELGFELLQRAKLWLDRYDGNEEALQGWELEMAANAILRGDREAVERHWENAADRGVEAGSKELSPMYEVFSARILAYLGESERARDCLKRAEARGFSIYPPELDLLLDPLRGTPEYESLVRSYREPWSGSDTARD